MNNNKKFTFKDLVFTVICPVLAVGIIALITYLIYKNPSDAILLGISGCALFVSVTIILAIVASVSQSNKSKGAKKGPVLGNIMYDRINTLNEPALICDASYKILWCNRFTSEVFGNKKVLASNLNSFFPYQLSDEKLSKKPQEIRVTIAGQTYIVDETRIDTPSQTYYLLILRNITALSDLEQFVRDNEKIVAYVIVDNLEELLQFEQEKYREVAARVESLIREWCDSVNGIIKEYEKDKYIFIFNMQDLDKFISDSFDILDKVRDIRVGSSSLPVTLSIGVAKLKNGTLAEKETMAHVALDMALQRGGDQAVVKLDDEIFFYGGRTNAVQKRTKVRARVVANQLASRMARASNVLVMGHSFPDYDAIGASIGIARLAMFCGVKVNIITNFKEINVKKCLKHFEGDDDYKNVFVDKSKGLDLVRPDTLLVIVDVNNINMFESKDVARMVNDVIIIDHHRKTAEFEREPIVSYIETSASSASEIVADILEQALPPKYLNQNEADMLYAGIVLDTRQFTKGTGTKTHSAAMYLRDNGATYENIQDLFKTNINDYRKESSFGEKIEIYRNCMAIALNLHGTDSSDRILAAKVADNLLTLEDVSASFALVKIGNTVHISARSNGTINVQLILEELNGGGRYDAAGAQVKDATVAETLMKLKQAIDGYINPEV